MFAPAPLNSKLTSVIDRRNPRNGEDQRIQRKQVTRILQFRGHPVYIVVICKVVERRPENVFRRLALTSGWSAVSTTLAAEVPFQRVGQLKIVPVVVGRPQGFVGFVVRHAV